MFIAAPREQIYSAMLDPAALEAWLPPNKMHGRVLSFDARPGGGFRMELTYLDSSQGKTSAHSDITEVTFAELLSGERVVQQVVFDSEDPAFAGTMTMTWTLSEAPNGTVVEIRADDVPLGISPRDHVIGMAESLDNLSAYVAATPVPPGAS